MIPRTVRGRIARKDELTETKTGRRVLRFSVAENSAYMRGDEWIEREAVFTRCEAWNELAEAIDDELPVGTPVVLVGDARARTYETEDGQKRTTQWVAIFGGGRDLGVKPAQAAGTDDENSEASGEPTTDPYND